MPRRDDDDATADLAEAVKELNETIQGKHGEIGIAGRLAQLEQVQKNRQKHLLIIYTSVSIVLIERLVEFIVWLGRSR